MVRWMKLEISGDFVDGNRVVLDPVRREISIGNDFKVEVLRFIERRFDPLWGEERVVIAVPEPVRCPWFREGIEYPYCASEGKEEKRSILGEGSPDPSGALDCLWCQLYGDSPVGERLWRELSRGQTRGRKEEKMHIREQLEKLAAKIWPQRVDVYHGWCASDQRQGWIARPFGQNEIFLGRNGREAKAYLENLLSYYEERRRSE